MLATTRVLALLAMTMLQAGARAAPDRQVARGQELWKQRCAECHAVDSDETGPRHRGVFGRKVASIKGYDYSPALRQSRGQWDAAALDRWLADPEQFIPGQNMDFKVADPGERAALISYLQTLSAGK
ncbi:putative cytochrome c [Janthinobacterium sp. HH01]|uniref:c-type cytochrome n=1 Tax=Janthinobacterium sp. HH01 TaxID=1198452 RepID=UPI0002AEC80B|nr:c-type cytochrome [Janthinobacterium sp. HH01]ELX13479.1 putative cytochrome c [Janthinobacterium sp. HH01]